MVRRFVTLALSFGLVLTVGITRVDQLFAQGEVKKETQAPKDDAKKDMRLLLHRFEPKRLFIFRHGFIRLAQLVKRGAEEKMRFWKRGGRYFCQLVPPVAFISSGSRLR